MNNIRKQIIEILEPYMDKTLSEGCLLEVYTDDWYTNDTIIKNCYSESDEDENIYIPTYEWYAILSKYKSKWHEQDAGVIKRILWHYDITAVSKYIWKRVYQIELDINQEYFEVSITSDDLVEQNFYFIPNKPLHLYTEQEEVNLLELLKKLWII